MTNIRIVRNKVDADEIPPYTTESVNESCSQPAQSLLNMTKNKEWKQEGEYEMKKTEGRDGGWYRSIRMSKCNIPSMEK